MDIEFQFNYQTVLHGTPAEGSIEVLRHHAIELGHAIMANCPESREKSLALTNLEQALMWAIKSISHNPEEES